MEQEKNTIPFIAYEDAMYYADRKNKRLLFTNILLFLMFIGSAICTGVMCQRQHDS
jgi:hypothetical protein